MSYRVRIIEKEISKAAELFSALLLTGPRRSGKTTMLRRLFPAANYVLLEDADTVARVRADPRSFLEGLTTPVIIDEIQHVPELFTYIRSRIDAEPEVKGRWMLTGSQEAPLMAGVSESMAGRAAIFSLWPMSMEEAPEITMLSGGFPEVLAMPEARDTWFRSYIQTYLERDVRGLTSIRDLTTFRRFMGILASRCGQMLNKTDIAAPLGVTVPTITQWLSILEVTGQILLVPPYYENFGKRLVKTPKLYFCDPGLACHLVGVRDEDTLQHSVFLGALFEGLVATEIIKHRMNRNLDRGLYYFRDKPGLEIDFVVDCGNRRLLLIEAKATRTPRPEDAKSIERLSGAISGYEVRSMVVHQSSATHAHPVRMLARGIEAVTVNQLVWRL